MKTISRLLAVSLSLAACSATPTSREPSSARYKIKVLGGDEKSFTPPAPGGPVVEDEKQYDVVVVGAGLAGLSAATFLSNAGKTVLLLEKEATFGGLAQGTSLPGSDYQFDRGAAYWTSAYEEEQQILNQIGLADFAQKHAIPEPIDSYYWNGKMYPGIWDDETLEKLPASFALFKNELQKASDEGFVPDQPIEDAPKMDLDKMDVRTWIRSMPRSAAKRRDDASKKIYARFKAEGKAGKLDRHDPMSGVIGLMDLYCRSALGTTGEQVSAIAFANFYISEIVTRYTTPIGTGQAAQNMVDMLKARANVTLQASSPVLKITNVPSGVDTVYAQDGKARRVHSKYLVFSAQLKFAPKIIEGFAKDAPEQAALMSGMSYSNYSVHNIEVQGHPYRLTYDTWTRASDFSPNDFTDFILGRWMDPAINGYDGYRDFKKDPEGNSIISIYNPLPLDQGYDFDQRRDRDLGCDKFHSDSEKADCRAKAIAAHAIDRLKEIYEPMMRANWNTHFEVLRVETSRWPYSVHIPAPGHFINKVKVMRKPYGNVFFGNNNLGTPAFEEALFRGHCAANNVLNRMGGFQQEEWSRCHLEQ